MYPWPSKTTWSALWQGGKGAGGGKAFQGHSQKLNYTGGDPMEFLRQNGMISYLGVVETTTANRPSRHVLESGEPWRAPPDDGSHAETPCQEQAKRATSGIRAPRVKKWKTINTANMFQALCGDDEDSQDSSGESTPPIPPSAHLPKRPNKTNNGKKASSIEDGRCRSLP